MGVITQNNYMSLIEAQLRAGYDDAAAVLGDAARVNQILRVLRWTPASHGLYHEVYQATRLGKGGFSRANSAMNIMSSSGGVAQEPVKLYEGESRIDERILKGVKYPGKVRDSEDALNLEGALQDWVTALLYANEGAGIGVASYGGATGPDAFNGLTARRASLSNYCLGCSGTGSDLTSVWLLELSKRGLEMTYPENAGPPAFAIDDRGKHLVRTPANDGDMWAWIRHFEIWGGLSYRDGRSILRLANIETTGTSNTFSSDQFLYLKNRLPSRGTDAVALANRTVLSQLEITLSNKSNMAYKIEDIEGFGPVMRWAGIPFLLCESIVDTETQVS